MVEEKGIGIHENSQQYYAFFGFHWGVWVYIMRAIFVVLHAGLESPRTARY